MITRREWGAVGLGLLFISLSSLWAGCIAFDAHEPELVKAAGWVSIVTLLGAGICFHAWHNATKR